MTPFSLLAEVLFVGHSLVGPDLPPMVEAALRALGQEARVEAQVINGAPLKYQWENGAAAEGVDARARLASGEIDVLVLTEGQPLADHVTWSDSAGYVVRWARAAWEANPQTQVLIYETWPSIASGPGVRIAEDPGGHLPWAERVAADRAVWQGLAEAANAVRPAGAPKVRVVPAGQAMARLAEAAAAGAVPGIGALRDVFDSDVHPNGRGLYLVAAVHAAVIAGKPPSGLPARLGRLFRDRRSVVTDEMAAALQSIAAEAIARDTVAQAPALPADAPAPAPAALPQPDPALAPAPDPAIAALGGVTASGIGMNLAGVSDWSTQLPFLNLLKSARPWIAHRPGRWGGWETADLRAAGHLDAGNWPQSLPPGATGMTTLVLTDLPADTAGAAGRYVLTWSGGGSIRVEGRAQNVRAQANRIVFDYSPGPGSVAITLTDIPPGNPPRDMVLVREDRAAALAAGHLFNPDFLARLRGVELIRAMDWMATNGSALAQPSDRPLPEDFTWAYRGVPVEVIAALANALDADAWFCVPHMAGDALVAEMARAAAAGLEPGRRAWVEYSNEVWNWGFPQAGWAAAQAEALWGSRDRWMEWYGLRAAQVGAIWAGVLGPDRLVRVGSTQTAWQGLEAQVFAGAAGVAGGGFDAWAVTGYFAAGLGTEDRLPMVRAWLAESLAAARAEADRRNLTGAARDAYVADHRFDLATARAALELADGGISGAAADTLASLLSSTLPYQADVARGAGLTLVMYEGGTHVVGLGPAVEDAELTAFFTHLNYAPEMGALYARLVQGWAALADTPFTAFNDVAPPSKWGSWGALRHLGDDNPRWRALARGCPSC